MYEVEVMLGATNESHIIRTIEYWDFERRQYAQRMHYAVIVAEGITKRFFNVIQLLSASIPIIAIQVNAHETKNGTSLAFTKLLDVYAEPEDEPSEAGESVDKTWWDTNTPWVQKIIAEFVALSGDLLPHHEIGYTKSYVYIRIDGKNLFRFKKKKSPNCFWEFDYVPQEADALRTMLEENNLLYGESGKHIYITISSAKLSEKKKILREVIQIAKEIREIE
jgi:hypothetical protein